MRGYGSKTKGVLSEMLPLLAQPPGTSLCVPGTALGWSSAGTTCAHTPMAGGVSTATCLGDTGPHQGGKGVRTAGRGCVPAGEQRKDVAPAAHCSGGRGGQGALPPPSHLAPKLTPLAA